MNQTPLYGEWGTDAQCSRSLITPNGTKYHAPFKVTVDWLQHGDSWCRLNWANVIENDNGIYAVADALCGEDDNRNYRINFSLYNGELTLLWSDAFENSGLMRCLK